MRRTLIRTAPKTAGGRPAASRWRAWARDLRGRHGRRPAHPGGVERILARPLLAGVSRLVRERQVFARLLRERWILGSRTVQPHIHLAIQPVLRPRSGPGLLSVLAAAPPLRTAFPPAAAVPGEALFAPAPAVFARAAEPAAAAVAAPGGGSAPAGAIPGTSPLSRTMAAPLQLVFRRLREPGEVPGASGARAGALAELPETARRLARKSRREEVPPGGQPARVLAAPPAGEEPRARKPSATPWESGPAPGTSSWPGSAVPAFPTPPPAVSVEVLTDQVMRQIDHRLHAWRERTGSF